MKANVSECVRSLSTLVADEVKFNLDMFALYFSVLIEKGSWVVG